MAKSSEEKEYESCSVVVAVRCRPFNEREKVMKAKPCLQFRGPSLTIFANGCPTDQLTPVDKDKGEGAQHNFTFDFAYDSSVGQDQLFEDIGKPVLKASYAGFNTCIFAYGQTGSGKSYSMMGPSGGRDSTKDPGLIPRICTSVFSDAIRMKEENLAEIAEAKEAGKPESEIPATLDFEVQLTYLEIYQEKVKCLLNPRKENLKVRQHPKLGVFVEGLTQAAVTSYEQVFEYIEGGNSFRHVSETKMNESSSRSHAIFTLIVKQNRTLVTKAGEDISERISRVNLVDLAGSERAKSTGAEGATLKEGSNINKSLTVLGQVISGLAEQAKVADGGKKASKAAFIPYRDSTLTWLLKENLGGNSKTFMLSALSPADVNYEETLSTLRYADRAKQIVTKACVNEDPRTKLIQDLQAELAEARRKMAMMEANQQIKPADVPSGVPKLNLGGKGSGMPQPQLQKIDGPRTPTSAHSQGSEPEMQDEWLNQTPRFPGQMAQFKQQAAVTETLISALGKTKEDQEKEELEAKEAREKEQAATKTTIKAKGSDPYLMNIEGGGDWVIEYLVDEVVYLAADPDKMAGEVASGSKIIKIEPHEDVGTPHCCLIRQTLAGSSDGTNPASPVPLGATIGYTLRSCEDFLTYVDDSESPIEGDVPLARGQTIQLGDAVNIKYIDNTAPLQSSRKARTKRASTTSGNALAATTGGIRLPLAASAEESATSAPAEQPSSATTTPAKVPGLSLGSLSTEKGSPVPKLNLGGSGTKHADPAATRTPRQGSEGKQIMAMTPRTIQIRGNNSGGGITPRSGAGMSVGGSLTARGLGSSNPAAAKSMPILRTPRSTTTARYASTVAEDMQTVNRHTFVVLGDTSTGKSSVRSIFTKEAEGGIANRFMSSFGSKKLPEVSPTLGFDSSIINAGNLTKADMTFLELSGIDSFASLQMMIPETRVTFVICWRLADSGDLSCFRKYLEIIQCRAPSSETNIILLATCRDLCKGYSDIDVNNALCDTQANLTNFLAALEPNESRRARVVHRFAISNKERSVIATNNKVKKMGDLLNWFADYAVTRCKTDVDFPHSLIPSRVLYMEKRVLEVRQRAWMIPSTEYKTLARTIDPRYERNIEELHKHTQILQSWGALHHAFRHMILKKFIVLDVRWTFQVVVALSCCISPNTQYIKSNQENQRLELGAPSEVSAMTPDPTQGNTHGGAPSFPPVISTFGDRLPFIIQDVYHRDPQGLLHQGVLTLPVAMALFGQLMREKGMTDLGKDLQLILELLEKHDMLMSGDKIFSRSLNNNSIHPTSAQASPSRRSFESLSENGSFVGEGDVSHEDVDGSMDLGTGNDAFYLIPACFNSVVPTCVSMHLAPLLFGPTMRFSLNTVPPFFFSRLVVRISQYAQKLYVGPITKQPQEINPATGAYTTPLNLQSAAFWGSCMWVVSSDVSRALIRMVQKSIFITFHDPCDDADFREGVATAVQSLISEFPGVRVETSEQCAYCGEWVPQAAPEDYYQTPESPVLRENSDGEIEEDEEYFEEDQEPIFIAPPCPQCNNPRFKTIGELLGSDFEGDKYLADIKKDMFLLDETEERLRRCFKHISKGRKLQRSGDDVARGSRIDGAGLDSLIDALATA